MNRANGDVAFAFPPGSKMVEPQMAACAQISKFGQPSDLRPAPQSFIPPVMQGAQRHYRLEWLSGTVWGQ